MAIDLDNAVFEECIAAAREAADERDFERALQAWEIVRARFPLAPVGYSGAGYLLRDLQRLDEAEEILAVGLEQVPDDEQTLVAHAWVAHFRGDMPEADRRWTDVRERFPECFDGYFGGGAVLCDLERYDEADEVYRTAFTLFPVVAHLLGDFAAVAQSRGDLEEAARRWNVLRTLFPDDHDGYVRQARALRNINALAEAEAVLLEAQQRFPDEPAPLIDFARIAEQRRDWSDALKRWDAVVTRFHGTLDGYVGAAGALNELGRYADAQTVLQPALRLFPESPAVATLNAWLAHRRQQYADAVQRWETLRERFPQEAVGYTGGIASLLLSGDAAAARNLSDAALTLFPDDLDVAVESARLPEYAQEWEEALAKWTLLLERFPQATVVKAGYAQSLLRVDRVEDAERVLESALVTQGGDLDLLRTFAECAAVRLDWPTAEVRWRQMIDAHPENAAGWVGLGDMLHRAGRLDDSEALLSEALTRFPDHAELQRHRALAATKRRDWPVALQRWEALRRQYPRDPAVRTGITDALWQARQDLGVLLADDPQRPAPFEIPPGLLADAELVTDQDEVRELMMQFESIGDTCEFGIVQRRFGAEPLSLLRWASTRPDALVTALDSDLAGVGEAEHTVVEVSEYGEYTTIDRRYRMFSHTFTPAILQPLETFTQQHLKRMQFLKRKLLEDLGTGEKIFVYKCDQGLSDEQAGAIFQAIRRHGGNAALLCVRLQDDAHPRGMVEPLQDGLFVGYIDHFSTVDIHVDAWVELCRSTLALRQPTRDLKGSS